jgi:hypothetical protein
MLTLTVSDDLTARQGVGSTYVGGFFEYILEKSIRPRVRSAPGGKATAG